jgi:hypothetical protein
VYVRNAQGTLRALAAQLNASAALLVELSRVACAVSVALGGDVQPLCLNTAAAIQPTGEVVRVPVNRANVYTIQFGSHVSHSKKVNTMHIASIMV